MVYKKINSNRLTECLCKMQKWQKIKTCKPLLKRTSLHASFFAHDAFLSINERSNKCYFILSVNDILKNQSEKGIVGLQQVTEEKSYNKKTEHNTFTCAKFWSITETLLVRQNVVLKRRTACKRQNDTKWKCKITLDTTISTNRTMMRNNKMLSYRRETALQGAL